MLSANMETLHYGLRALQLTSYPRATISFPNRICDVMDGPYDPPSIPHFRFYDLPPELQLRILETYVSTLYPRIVHRCICHLCEPLPSTALSSSQNLVCQQNAHRTRLHDRFEKYVNVSRRFSYCQDLPPDPNIRTLEHGSGRDFDFPYAMGPRPAEPGLFLASKRLRQDAIDILVKTRPLYMFSQDGSYRMGHIPRSDRSRDVLRLPIWYRRSLRFGEELQPDTTTIAKLPGRWLSEVVELQEMRLNYGPVNMSTKMKLSWEKLEWIQGVPKDLLQGMVRRRVWVMMRKICICSPRDDEEDNQDLWLDQSKIPGLNEWDAAWKSKPTWERNWKVVLLVEFRVRVREDETSKRQWASIVSHGPLH